MRKATRSTSVITNSLDQSATLKNLRVDECGISDHHCVHCELSTQKPRPVRKSIQFRKTKPRNIIDLKDDIRASKIEESVMQATSMSDKINIFNNTISAIVNKHAPLVKRNIVLRPNIRWYSDDIREAKKRQRTAKKNWRKTRLEIHRQLFKKARNHTNRLIVKSKEDNIKTKISENKKNSRKLYRIVDGLVRHSKPGENLPSLKSKENLTDMFAQFFTNKIENLRKELDKINVRPMDDQISYRNNTNAVPALDYFPPASHKEINTILKTLPTKTCSLDPFPTWIAIQCVDELTHVITSIVNASFKLGEMHSILKRAVVRPVLKKAGLNKDD
ncbi:RNA-directed DNA polymerase from mobile element jockey [Elysia marginata]|uniref:RNA-directed DNA polymerase from mobile element jockey n=1 Tax=Elysia marginata TaxID=1093978 RepID=A0AAV4H3N3_9GAST|nr:RNA-directed DNA polymerase from mobile element jockey [Elysia marginata]